MICPGIQPRMATVMPAGVSESLAPVAPELCGLAVPWVEPGAGWPSPDTQLYPKGILALMSLRTPSTLLDNLLWIGTQYGAEALKFLSPDSQILACGRDLRWP